MRCTIPVAVGELFDKFSILKLKQVKIQDPQKLALINHEVEQLSVVMAELPVNTNVVDKLIQEMIEVNQLLWDIEDEIRKKEAAKEFGPEFVELARSVYITNDMRFDVKNRINRLFKSELQERKQLLVCQQLLRNPAATPAQQLQCCQQAAALLLQQQQVSNQAAYRTSAMCFLRRVLDLLPSEETVTRAAVSLQLARLHARQCQFAPAHRCFLDYLHLHPADHQVSAELATICLAAHQTSVAVALLRGLPEAFLVAHPVVRKDLGVALLQQQDHWDLGWHHFEARLDCVTPALDIPEVPRWTGDGDVSAPKHLLLLDEQGIGDTLQFFRYALQLLQVLPHTHMYFCAKAAVSGLLHPSYHERLQVVTSAFVETHVDLFDQKAFLCSLPHLLHLGQPEPLNEDCRYIRVHSKFTKHWQKTLFSNWPPTCRIGFCLRGSRSGTVEKNLDFVRVVHECFAPFHAEARFVCLNKRSEDPVGIDLVDHFDFVHFPEVDERGGPPFSDTAALVSQLDLVISVDTAVAHLAANLGKPVWLLLGALSDWRWGDPGTECLWYNNVRFFRATEPNQFDAVFPQVQQALRELLQQ